MLAFIAIINLLLVVLINGIEITNNDIKMCAKVDNNWGEEAVKYFKEYNSKEIYTPTVVFIDAGDVNKELNVDVYSVVPTSSQLELSNHADYIIRKFLQLNSFSNIIYIKASNSDIIEYENLIEAMEKAIYLEPDIISMSIGTMRNYTQFQSLVNDAIKKNIVLVASAGNSGLDLLYPAYYSGVISVMARDINNLDCDYNNKSDKKKSFSAPGEEVYVDGKYISGTSIATSYVTALIAKIISCVGKNKLSNEKIINILKRTSVKSNKYSYGLIQFKDALYAIKNFCKAAS